MTKPTIFKSTDTVWPPAPHLFKGGWKFSKLAYTGARDIAKKLGVGFIGGIILKRGMTCFVRNALSMNWLPDWPVLIDCPQLVKAHVEENKRR